MNFAIKFNLWLLNKILDESNLKCFVCPDAAVLLLIELYREKQHEFNTGTKRHNVIWGDIAAQMKEADKKYAVTGLQCSTKFSGLRRTYKNIYEQNKKSGNSHSSWAFYSVSICIYVCKYNTMYYMYRLTKLILCL